MAALKILFVATEMDPLIKVGGLGDVAGALPAALARLGHDVRVLLPAVDPELLADTRPLARLGQGRARLVARKRSVGGCPVWLLSTPALNRRRGRPYLNRAGQPWADNAEQFGLLGRTAADIAAGRLGKWRPDVVHCNDWHTALAPVWLHLDANPAASVFTIHNLGFPGSFEPEVLGRLGLPMTLYHPDALEFYGRFAFIKGGLRFAQQLTTVSPRYAREILSPEFGCGLDGLLRARSDRLTGILNGLDYDTWNPASDPALEHRFDSDDRSGKQAQRASLCRHLGLADDTDRPLLCWVGRLTAQKGADLLLEALPELLKRRMPMVVLGSGDRDVEMALRKAARQTPRQLAVHTGFDAPLAHRIYAGADLLLMPSRFEPCGLTQMCAMAYGTLPLVTVVGGLADTVIDCHDPAPGADGPCGFHIADLTTPAILQTVDAALDVYRKRQQWNELVGNAMRRRFEWSDSARHYETVYHAALAELNGKGDTP
jgi:starch synthase